MIKKIMLVDDDEFTNLYHEIILKDENLAEELIVSITVDEALKALSELKDAPEFIFLDINLPLKNAWEFIDECEEKGLAEDSKIIILSTSSNPSDRTKAEENSRVHAFMTKPLDVEILKEWLHE